MHTYIFMVAGEGGFLDGVHLVARGRLDGLGLLTRHQVGHGRNLGPPDLYSTPGEQRQ